MLKITTNGTNGHANRWVPIIGNWEIPGSNETVNPKDRRGLSFLGSGKRASAHGETFAMGLAVSNTTLRNGTCSVAVRFSGSFGETEQAAGIVVGYHSPDQHYVFFELGANRSAYTVGEHEPGFGWRPIASTGEQGNLRADRDYDLRISLQGQELRMFVDDVPVMEQLLTKPLEGRQVGLIAAGNKTVSFSRFTSSGSDPRAFVAMHFAEPYDTFFRDVIDVQAKKAGYVPFRIDQQAGPGIIFQEIQREIEQSDIVIAEITPSNPNVFYELGYAHALHKPTILLARRETQLPFDIRSYRVVFYNDTIGGKAEVEENLARHLAAISAR